MRSISLSLFYLCAKLKIKNAIYHAPHQWDAPLVLSKFPYLRNANQPPNFLNLQ
jgi:hypothetical protein